MDDQHAEPPNPWAPVGAPPPPQPRPRTGLIVGISVALAALILVVVGGFGVSHLISRALQSRQSQPAEDVVLQQVPGDGEAPKFGGTALYDACSVITIDQLTELGVPLAGYGRVIHEHLDGDLSADAVSTQTSVDTASYCAYELANDNWLSVRVHQTPFNAAADMAQLQERATTAGGPPRTENGLSVVQSHNDLAESQDINIWKQDLLIIVSIETIDPGPYGTMDVQTFASKLEPLAKSAIAKDPTAPTRHVHAGPLGTLRHPCEVANRAAFQRAFPSQAGTAARVEATFYVAAAHPRGEWEGLMSCVRRNLVPHGSSNRAEYRELLLELAVSESEQAASSLNTTLCTSSSTSGDVVAVTPPVGTGRTCMTKVGTDWTLRFQLGNVNIRIESPLGENPFLNDRREQFLPAAQAIAEAGVIR